MLKQLQPTDRQDVRLLPDGRHLPLQANRYQHAWWLLYLPLHLLLFAYVEKAVIAQYWVSHIPLDDHVPFIAPFVYFYILWYPFQLAAALWLILRDADAFRRYIWSFMIGCGGSLLFCRLFPNGQDLRPLTVPGNDLAASLVRSIYAADTNTNVLPSTHVIGALLVVFAAFDSPTIRRPWRIAAVVLAVLINLSTVLIKQHSMLDVFAGLAVSAIVYLIVYVGIRRNQNARPPRARLGD